MPYRTAIDQLTHGHRLFLERDYPRLSDRYRSLAGGQSPRVMFVTCADSRVNPSVITRLGPGELFVLRNAGNIVPPAGSVGGDVATLQYAVSALGVEEIVVCGHSDCGAMKGLLAPESCAHLGAVSDWIRLARPALEAVSAEDDATRLNEVIKANVCLQISNIRTHPFVVEAEAAGKLRVHGCVFDIGSGSLLLLDETTDELRPIATPRPDRRRAPALANERVI